MKLFLKWLLLTAAVVQFVTAALPPGNADLLSVHSLAYDLARRDKSFLYPGKDFEGNDLWVAHHEQNLLKLNAAGQPNWCFYPPLVPFVLTPIASASAETWRLTWGAAQIVFVVLFAWIIAKMLDGRHPERRAQRVLVFALVIGSYPVARAIELGQTSLVAAVIFWAAIWAGNSRREIWRAIGTGVVFFLKPFLAVAVLANVRDNVGRMVAAITVMLGLVVLSVVSVGIAANLDYARFLRTLSFSQTSFYGNQSLLGGLLRLVTKLPVMDYGFQQSGMLAAVGVLVALIVLGLAGWVQWRSRLQDEMLSIGLWLSAAILALPISWEHHLLFLLPVLAVLWQQSSILRLRLLLGAATLLMSMRWVFFYGDDVSGRLAAGLPLAGHMVLFGYLLCVHLSRNLSAV
jgi:alpha-1,2-mannosyltransferase